jgi:hypothetical protein
MSLYDMLLVPIQRPSQYDLLLAELRRKSNVAKFDDVISVMKKASARAPAPHTGPARPSGLSVRAPSCCRRWPTPPTTRAR